MRKLNKSNQITHRNSIESKILKFSSCSRLQILLKFLVDVRLSIENSELGNFKDVKVSLSKLKFRIFIPFSTFIENICNHHQPKFALVSRLECLKSEL